MPILTSASLPRPLSRASSTSLPAPPPRPMRSVSLPAPQSISNPPTSRASAPEPESPYIKAHALLSSPLQDGPPVQQALAGLMRGDRPGDDVVRLLALAHLPWGRAHAALFGDDCPLAPHTLVLMLHALFPISNEQGQRLLPLLREHALSRSLAQWTTLLCKPRHEHQGALKLRAVDDAGDLDAITSQLDEMLPAARMNEGQAALALLHTLLPKWSGKQQREVYALWRDDRTGWSLADAALRARDLQEKLPARPAADVLQALEAERKRDRPPAAAPGSVADAGVGLLNLLLGGNPLAAPVRTLSFGARLSGGTWLPNFAPHGPVVQQRTGLPLVSAATTPRGLVSMRLRDLDQRLQEQALRKDYYTGQMQQMVAWQLSRPTEVSAPASTARRPASAPPVQRNSTGNASNADASELFAVPDDLHSPGRLTPLGARPSMQGLSTPRASGVDAAPLQPLAPAVNSTTPPPSADEQMINKEIERIETQLPQWLKDAPLGERNYLQTLSDLHGAWEDVWITLISGVDSLETYTHDALAKALNATGSGQGFDPATVNVTVTERRWPDPEFPGAFLDAPVVWPVPPGGIEPVLTERTVSLVEFAIGNIAQRWLLGPDHDVSMERHINGSTRALSEKEVTAVVDLVRRLDVGSTYPDYLRDILLWPLSPLAGPLRQAWVHSNGLLLEAALQAARLQGSTFPKDYYTYLDPISGHDLASRMLEHVLQHPDERTRPELETYTPYVHALKIGYADSALGTLLGGTGACRVNGVWVVEMDAPDRGVTSVVVVTPGAPDGKIIRVYDDMQAAKSDPYWRTDAGYGYLKERMSHEDQVRADGLAFGDDPVKSRMPRHPGRFTAEKVQLERIHGDFLHEAFEYMAHTMIRDGASASTTTAEVDWSAALSSSFDVALTLDDVTSPLPLGKLLGKLKLLLKPGRWFDAGTSTIKAGQSLQRGKDITGRKSPFSRIVKLNDGRIGVLAGPPGPPASAPNWAQLDQLQDRSRTLVHPPARQLSLPDERELRRREVRELDRLKEELTALKGAYSGPYEFDINSHRETWWPYMDRVPELSGLNDAERSQYVAYLLSQREASAVSSMLRSLSTVGVQKASLPFRAMHGRAIALVEGGRAGSSTAVQPAPGPAPGSSLTSPTKKLSDGTGSGSPKKPRLSQPLQDAGGSVPPPSDFRFEVVPRDQWPPSLFHYTTRANYNKIMSDGGINPSDVDPMGKAGKGPAPRIVYVTPLVPELGRTQLEPRLFGRSSHGSRSDKLECAIEMKTEHFSFDTVVTRYTGTHSDVWTVGPPGGGYIPLRVAEGESSVLVKPVPGSEIVPW